MYMLDAKTKTLGSSGSYLPLKKRIGPFNNNALVATKKVSGDATYKGVVKQQNGHWGAQIYADQRRIWLGTFKSAAEAATAYDSASMKLRGSHANSYRNFPLTDFTVHEPDFQEPYTTEDVLNMIRDGSYKNKFRDFLRIRSQMVADINLVGSELVRGGDEEWNKCFLCTELFQKKLTPSDVGKLNRLVIPKKHAVKYLPSLSADDPKEIEDGEVVDDFEVVFYDKAMRQWKFRYCYWKSSQSFVLTRGWNGFVKEKNLKEKDVVVFYTCHVKTLEGQSNSFFMIDIHCFSGDDEEVVVNETFDNLVMEKGNVLNTKLEDKETRSEENKGGFMLFGVRIQQ